MTIAAKVTNCHAELAEAFAMIINKILRILLWPTIQQYWDQTRRKD
jgi:hypothetical protein